jgi:hypothetical protein
MRGTILTIVSLIILFVPGSLIILIAWSLVFPKHQKPVFKFIRTTKGNNMRMKKILGIQTGWDHEYVSKVDLTDIDTITKKRVDKAFSYLEKKAKEKPAYGAAKMVLCFGIGAAIVMVIWILSQPATL